MARIILMIEGKENRQLLNAFLSAYHSVGEHPMGEPLEEPFDLCIVDAVSFGRVKAELEVRRDQEQPGILPVLLVSQREAWTQIPNLWQLVDESITLPVSKIELQSRVEILLRA